MPPEQGRHQPRFDFQADLSDLLHLGESDEKIPGVTVNISCYGLGIITFVPLSPGQNLRIIWKQSEGISHFKVAWSMEDQSNKGMFHSGLELQERQSLPAIFAAEGFTVPPECIK